MSCQRWPPVFLGRVSAGVKSAIYSKLISSFSNKREGKHQCWCYTSVGVTPTPTPTPDLKSPIVPLYLLCNPGFCTFVFEHQQKTKDNAFFKVLQLIHIKDTPAVFQMVALLIF